MPGTGVPVTVTTFWTLHVTPEAVMPGTAAPYVIRIPSGYLFAANEPEMNFGKSLRLPYPSPGMRTDPAHPNVEPSISSKAQNICATRQASLRRRARNEKAAKNLLTVI